MVLEPLAGALEVDHVGVMDDAVDHRGGGGDVALHLAPAGERQVVAVTPFEAHSLWHATLVVA